MPDNWSVDEENIWRSRELVPSDGKDNHPDPRMQLTLKDMPKCELPRNSDGGKRMLPLVFSGVA